MKWEDFNSLNNDDDKDLLLNSEEFKKLLLEKSEYMDAYWKCHNNFIDNIFKDFSGLLEKHNIKISNIGTWSTLGEVKGEKVLHLFSKYGDGSPLILARYRENDIYKCAWLNIEYDEKFNAFSNYSGWFVDIKSNELRNINPNDINEVIYEKEIEKAKNTNELLKNLLICKDGKFEVEDLTFKISIELDGRTLDEKFYNGKDAINKIIEMF